MALSEFSIDLRISKFSFNFSGIWSIRIFSASCLSTSLPQSMSPNLLLNSEIIFSKVSYCLSVIAPLTFKGIGSTTPSLSSNTIFVVPILLTL